VIRTNEVQKEFLPTVPSAALLKPVHAHAAPHKNHPW